MVPIIFMLSIGNDSRNSLRRSGSGRSGLFDEAAARASSASSLFGSNGAISSLTPYANGMKVFGSEIGVTLTLVDFLTPSIQELTSATSLSLQPASRVAASTAGKRVSLMFISG